MKEKEFNIVLRRTDNDQYRVESITNTVFIPLDGGSKMVEVDDLLPSQMALKVCQVPDCHVTVLGKGIVK